MKLSRFLGQSMVEYSMVLIVVVAALIAMQVYIKRAAQGRLRKSYDEISEPYNPRSTVGISKTTMNIASERESDNGLTTDKVLKYEQGQYRAEEVFQQATE